MPHFARLRFAAGTVAAGCASAPAVSFAANPAFQEQTQPNSATATRAAQQNLRNDLAALKKDAKILAGEDTIGLDMAALASDYGNEQQDWQSEQSGLQTSNVAAVSNDLSDVRDDLTALKLLGVTPQVTTSSQVAAGNKVLDSANDAINAAYAKSASVNKRAQRLLVSARDWAKKHAC